MGEFDLDVFDNKALKLILALFIFVVVVVLLNVLIAIVSNSHDDITDKVAAGLFYRSRLEYIADTTPIVKRLPLFLKRKDNDARITRRIKEALEQYEEGVSEDDTDATRLAAIRDSEERTNKKLADMEKKIDELTSMLQKLQKLLPEE